MSVYVVALVGNETGRPVKSRGRTMVCQLFAANPERGRGRNYVTCFSPLNSGILFFCIFTVLPLGIPVTASAAGGGCKSV